MKKLEKWGRRNPIEDEQIPYEQPLEKVLRQEQFEGLEEFWQEVKEVGDPMQHAEITRRQNGEYADTVSIKYPNNRIETYVTDASLDRTVLSIMGEEAGQHGSQTFRLDYDEVAGWMQDIIELEDDKEWLEYKKPLTYKE